MLILLRVDLLYFEDYFMGLLTGEREMPEGLEELTGPIIKSIDEGVDLAVEYYNAHEPSAEVIAVRKCIAKAMAEFHTKAGLMDDGVKAELTKMVEPDVIIVEVAHQPNIFPYSGFYKKIVLGKVLGDRLQERLDAPVAVTFGFHDQDLANPKWFRTTNLPDLSSQNGLLSLKLPVSRKSKMAMYMLPKLADKQVEAWKTVLENWLTNNIRKFNKMIKEHHDIFGLDESFMLDKGRTNIIRGRMRRIYELIDDCHSLAGGISEFNSFFTAKLVNDHWKYPMLFYDYHRVASCFEAEYTRLMGSVSLMESYSKTFASSFRKAADADISFDFKVPSADQAPFWYQCECGGKVEVAFDLANPELMLEQCPACGSDQRLSLDEIGPRSIDDRISPRAAYRPLLIANTLMPSIFVSGLSAQGFHMISRGLAAEFDTALSPFIIWPGGDDYRSLAKLVAEMTHAEIEAKPDVELSMKEKKLNENYTGTMATIPSIIDNLVNTGLKEVSEAWEDDLIKNKDLSNTPTIPSIFDP